MRLLFLDKRNPMASLRSKIILNFWTKLDLKPCDLDLVKRTPGTSLYIYYYDIKNRIYRRRRIPDYRISEKEYSALLDLISRNQQADPVKYRLLNQNWSYTYRKKKKRKICQLADLRDRPHLAPIF